MHRIKYLGVLYLCITLSSRELMAQPLTVNAINYSDSTVWYVQNNTADTLYPTSITCKVHHMLPNMAILPVNTGPGFFNNTQKTTIKGRNYTWKYATTFGCSVSDTLFPGSNIPVAISVNYNNKFIDTIMPASTTLFTNRPEIKEWAVVPFGASCEFKRIFITSRWTEQGIHYYSTINPSLNPNVCQSISSGAAVANAFNPYTLMQTASRVVPKCPGGRQWTSFGFPKDSVLYYSFNAKDNKHLDSIIEGLDSGDYFAFASWPIVSAADLYSQTAIWAKVGLDVNELPSGGSGQFCFLGRKGLAKGKAMYRYVKQLGSTVSVTSDFVMIKDQELNELKPYPDCFEDIAVVHQPYIPEIVQNSVTDFKKSVKIYPNPANQRILNFHCTNKDGKYLLMDVQGRTIQKGLFRRNNLHSIKLVEGLQGSCFLLLQSDDGVLFKTSIIVKTKRLIRCW